MKDYNRIKHMRNLNDSLIWERMKRCYDFGYEDGKADTPFTDTEEAEKKAYNRGLNEAWEAAGKLYKISSDDYSKLFEMKSPYFDFSIQEVLTKIKEYEDKQTEDAEIKVGDEVKIIGSNPVYDDCDYGVCTYVKKDKIYVMRKDGSASEERKSEWDRTGRAIPQIAEVLAEMRGAENDK